MNPEEGEPRAGNGAAEHDEFARARDVRHTQISWKHRVAGHVREDRRAEATITVGMMASPSRPSVRLTALEKPTTRQAKGMMKPDRAQGNRNRLEERHNQGSVCCGKLARYAKVREGGHNTAIAVCQNIFDLAESPSVLIDHLAVIIDQPMAPKPMVVIRHAHT